MQITIEPTGINNFHNCPGLRVRVSGEVVQGVDGAVYVISKRQAQRIEQHFCGVKDCACAAGGMVEQLDPDGNTWGLRITS